MILGRTNREFPADWYRPLVSPQWESLIGRLGSGDSPIDISSSAGLWGHALAKSSAPILFRVGRGLHGATEARHATELVQAELIENLSCLGRPKVEMIALAISRPLEEYQIDGALEALEMARQEGHFEFLALAVEGNPMAARGAWQFHDAFELLLVRGQDAFGALSPLAKERRVGVVATDVPGVEPQLWEVTE